MPRTDDVQERVVAEPTSVRCPGLHDAVREHDYRVTARDIYRRLLVLAVLERPDEGAAGVQTSDGPARTDQNGAWCPALQ